MPLIVAVRDFSGLTSSDCALAKAQASAATESLDRGMSGLRREYVETHCARFGTLGSQAMPDCFLGVLRHQSLELVLGPLMIEEGVAGGPEQSGKLRPGVGRAHVDDADRLNAGTRRLGV